MLSSIPTSWRWCLWSLYVLAWTTALLMPVPVHGDWHIADSTINLRYIFAKTVHVSAYALLAGLTGWLQAPLRWRFVLMFFVMVHATLTETLQLALPALGRSGELSDVGLDNVGIAVGVVLTWRWWTAADAITSPAPAGPSASD